MRSSDLSSFRSRVFYGVGDGLRVWGLTGVGDFADLE